MPKRRWLHDSRVSTAERVGEGSSPRSSASPVSYKARQRLVGTPSASSIRAASTSRTPPFKRQPPVAGAGVRRLARALGPEVEQAAAAELVKLGVEETPPVADLRVVAAELVAVIAHRQRAGLRARQGFEAHEGAGPLVLTELLETHRRGRPRVGNSGDGLREVRRLDGIGELRPEVRPGGGGARAVEGDGHLPHRRWGSTAEGREGAARRRTSGRLQAKRRVLPRSRAAPPTPSGPPPRLRQGG